MIPFNKPNYTGLEDEYVIEAMRGLKMSGDGRFGLMCQRWFEGQLGVPKALLTTSCTHALEMAAILLELKDGDEVIMPSYTFVSTANAFALRGARIVFVDIRPDTMNIDEKLISDAITDKTRAIVVVHYAGVSCEMDAILSIANANGIPVVEDAAQGIMSTYKGRALGTLGALSAYSFHETKNITSGGEGGLLIINDEKFVKRAEIIREKGTNRSQFFRGMVDKYSWVDIGSSYLPSELQAAYLWGQLLNVKQVTESRRKAWQFYQYELMALQNRGLIELQCVPDGCEHNAHMFYVKVRDLHERTKLISYLDKYGVQAVFHYVPLHSTNAGQKLGRLCGIDQYTTDESERLVRLPLWYGIGETDQQQVVNAVINFYEHD